MKCKKSPQWHRMTQIGTNLTEIKFQCWFDTGNVYRKNESHLTLSATLSAFVV